MRLHQVITGSTNTFQDQATFACGTVDGINFTAYASGCDLVILANDFQRVQIIPGVAHGEVQITCIDCSNDAGKVAASYANQVCIFEPVPLLYQTSSHRLDYQWHETSCFTTDCFVTTLSWNREATLLLTGGEVLHVWRLLTENEDLHSSRFGDSDASAGNILHSGTDFHSVKQQQLNAQQKLFSISGNEQHRSGNVKFSLDEDEDENNEEASEDGGSKLNNATATVPDTHSHAHAPHIGMNVQSGWCCVWKCRTATPIAYLCFSPDATFFASAGKADRLVKVWYENTPISVNNSDYQEPYFPGSAMPPTSLNIPGMNAGGSMRKVSSTQQNHNASQRYRTNFSFVYLAHPKPVTGFSWRKVSKYMPKGSVASVLLTSCQDNICRIWVETFLPDDGLFNLNMDAPGMMGSTAAALSSSLLIYGNKQLRVRHRRHVLERFRHIRKNVRKLGILRLGNHAEVGSANAQTKSLYISKKAQKHAGQQQPTTPPVLQATSGTPAAAKPGSSNGMARVPSLTRTYSSHDVHYHQGATSTSTTIARGCHFHLASSIDADRDIPLVPLIGQTAAISSGPSALNGNAASIGSPTQTHAAGQHQNQQFAVHWLNNKEMLFTWKAEQILHDLSRQALNQDLSNFVRENNADASVSDFGAQGGFYPTDNSTELESGTDTDTVEGANVNDTKKSGKTKRKKLFRKSSTGKQQQQQQQQKTATMTTKKTVMSSTEDVSDHHHLGSSLPARYMHQSMLSVKSTSDADTLVNFDGHSSGSGATGRSGLMPVDVLDKQIEVLVRQWHQSSDLLFCVHPLDGSFLVWIMEWLDEEEAGAFRQVQVSFSSRIPQALPLADALSACARNAVYCTHSAFVDMCSMFKLANDRIVAIQRDQQAARQQQREEKGMQQQLKRRKGSAVSESGTLTHRHDDGIVEDETHEDDPAAVKPDVNAESHALSKQSQQQSQVLRQQRYGSDLSQQNPVVSLITSHTNGSLNLWQITFLDRSNFDTIISIKHKRRRCGHRFRVNDITSHPLLPLVLTTSHHNVPDSSKTDAAKQPGADRNVLARKSAAAGIVNIPQTDAWWLEFTLGNRFCSELILWKVENIGPLSKSSGMTELARINSPELSAFSNVAWLPTLLPSWTLGLQGGHGPSTCFVASDGHSLRIYQAVVDARSILAEHSMGSGGAGAINLPEHLHNPKVAPRMLSTKTSGYGRTAMLPSLYTQFSNDSNGTQSDAGEQQMQQHRQYEHDTSRLNIVSLQSSSKPGCIIALDSIADAKHDWHNTQLLHVFPAQMIHAGHALDAAAEKRRTIFNAAAAAAAEGISTTNLFSRLSNGTSASPLPNRTESAMHPQNLEVVIDLSDQLYFEEIFYLFVLERMPHQSYSGSMLHMWRITVSSHQTSEDAAMLADGNLTCGDGQRSPNSLIEEDEDEDEDDDGKNKAADDARSVDEYSHRSIASSTKLVASARPSLRIRTTKVCRQKLPLPPGVDVVHASVAAGHLSSSSIYPACSAPYLVSTACSDGKTRFWRCRQAAGLNFSGVNKNLPNSDAAQPLQSFIWEEWKMMLGNESAIATVGQPLAVSAAYSGRIAVASRMQPQQPSDANNKLSADRMHAAHPTASYSTTPGAANSVQTMSQMLSNLSVAIFECESTGGSEWLLEDTIHLHNVHVTEARVKDELDEPSRLRREKQSVENFSRIFRGHEGMMPHVASVHSLRKAIVEQGNTVFVRPKALVHLDWVSTEDGGFLLTIAVGSQIMIYAAVSQDIAQANIAAMKEAQAAARRISLPENEAANAAKTALSTSSRPAMNSQQSFVSSAAMRDETAAQADSTFMSPTHHKQSQLARQTSLFLAPLPLSAPSAGATGVNLASITASSLQPYNNTGETFKWLRLRVIELETADLLPPIPMNLSWVRTGLLLVGMDNEMQIFSQWRSFTAPSTTRSKFSVSAAPATTPFLVTESHSLATMRMPMSPMPISGVPTYAENDGNTRRLTDEHAAAAPANMASREFGEFLHADARNLSEFDLLHMQQQRTPSRMKAASNKKLPSMAAFDTATGMLNTTNSSGGAGGRKSGGQSSAYRNKLGQHRGSLANIRSRSGEASIVQSVAMEAPISVDLMIDFGLFEAAYLASPTLPQYHPKQLTELLNFGRLNRVRAILNHVLRCIYNVAYPHRDVNALYSADGVADADDIGRGRGIAGKSSWTSSGGRRSSIVASSAAAALITMKQSSQDGNPAGATATLDDDALDYIEIETIPPLPLNALLDADTYRGQSTSEAEQYNALFSEDNAGGLDAVSDLSDLDDILEDAETGSPSSTMRRKRRRKVKRQNSASAADSGGAAGSVVYNYRANLINFNAPQADVLAKMMTHIHLPGLSSLDQMHLMALSDTIANCTTTFAERSTAAAPGGEAGLTTAPSAATTAGPPKTDMLDECGLRFLLALKQHMFLLKCLPMAQRMRLQRRGIDSSYIAWAFHSENQEQLLESITAMHRGEMRWKDLRHIGAGWWLRNNQTLKLHIERVAKTQFQQTKEPLDAALLYIAMRKKAVVWGLYRSVANEKMVAFFKNDFSQDRWRTAALKNAYVLLGKQKFEHAAAFFLLGGAVKDAVEVCVNKMKDLQLALVIVRLYEADSAGTADVNATFGLSKSLRFAADTKNEDNLGRLLRVHVLGEDLSSDADRSASTAALSAAAEGGEAGARGRFSDDPFLRSISYWTLKDYGQSVRTLLDAKENSSNVSIEATSSQRSSHHSAVSTRPSIGVNTNTLHDLTSPTVFNFYNFLRTHPVILRHNQTVYGSKTGITPKERRLFFTTAHMHLQAGCPLLAMEVLCKLPDQIISAEEQNEAKLRHQVSQAGTTESSGIGTTLGGLLSEAQPGSALSDIVDDAEGENNIDADDGNVMPPEKPKKTEAPKHQPTTNNDAAGMFDWSMPAFKPKEEVLDLTFDDDENKEDADEDAVDAAATLNADQNGLEFMSSKKQTPLVNGDVEHELTSVRKLAGSKVKSVDTDQPNKILTSPTKTQRSATSAKPVDIMAQQLKFIAGLKILMEELRTLSSGYDVEGGQLRYHLYLWLEKEVDLLKRLCDTHGEVDLASVKHASDAACAGAAAATGGGGTSSQMNVGKTSDSGALVEHHQQGPSLHEIILADKLDFDARLLLTKRRKYWLKNHQQLLRSFINYCSLYGATGGGLTSVHMELTLLMQELHQGTLQQQKQLQSPLPFPTTLPLVSAYVAAQKPLQGDPVQLLTTLSTDILSSLSAIQCAPKYGDDLSIIFTMRDISVALSSCVYESLCDADSLISSHSSAVNRIARRKSGDAGSGITPPPPPIGLEAFSIAAASSQCSGGSQLMMVARSQQHPRSASGAGGAATASMRSRSGATAASLLAAAMHESSDTTSTMPTTQPSKWPGVQSLRALIAREKDDDAPKLHILLLEIYCAVYMALVFYALATYDCNLLYRLVGHTFNVRTWSELFGGGAKKSVRVRLPSSGGADFAASGGSPHSYGRNDSVSSQSGQGNGGDQWNKQRFWMHMKLLGQNKAGQMSSNAKSAAAAAEAGGASASTTSREVFVPPKMSIVHCLLMKPKTAESGPAGGSSGGRPRLVSYDSNASLPADVDEDDENELTAAAAITDLPDDLLAADTKSTPRVVKKAEHTDPYSYAWNILRLAVLKVAHKHIVSAFNVLSLDLQDLPVVSPLLYAVLLKLDQWERVQSQLLDDFVAAPPDFIPEQAQPSTFNLGKIGAAISSVTGSSGGPAVQRYRAMLEPHNTPFYKTSSAQALPAKRLWSYLIQQDALQETFIRYIFRRSHRGALPEADGTNATPVPSDIARPHTSADLYSNYQPASRSQFTTGGANAQSSALLAEMDRTAHATSNAVLQYVMPIEPTKVIQKDQEPIASFCWNNANSHWIAMSTAKEIIELDIGLLLSPPSWLEDELEYDIANLRSNFNDSPDPDFVVLRTPYDRVASGAASSLDSSLATPTPSTNTAAAVALANSNTLYGGGGMGGFGVGIGGFSGGGNGPLEPATLASGRASTLNMKGLNEPALGNHKYLLYVMERSMHMMKKLISRPVRDVRRLAAHPALPYYLSGSQDGSVRLWEFNHSPPLSTLCQSTSLAKINWLAFNAQGNKFGATDADGVVRLWQLCSATTNAVPYRALKCHSKTCSAFSFISSSSVLATCGFSNENRNVAVWDTLAPAAQAQIAAFVCHDQGSPCMTYASQHQLLITGGKRGDVCIFDIRQRRLMHKFQAHDPSSGAIRTIALDPSQEFFVTGAADGDIKLWTLAAHSCIATLSGEHAKSGLFSRNITGGVSQVAVDANMRLFSCGADGYFKLRNLTGIDAHILRVLSEKQQPH